MTLTAFDAVQAALYLSVLAAAAVAVGGLVADRLGGDALDRALVWVLGAVAHPLAVGLVLGGLGLLHPWAVLVLSGATGAVAAVVRRRHHPVPKTMPAATTVVAVAAASMLGVAALALGLRAVDSQEFESRHYHYEAIAHFVVEGSIWSLPFQNPGFFTATHPGNAEVLGAVVALATGGEHLIYAWILPVAGLLVVLAGAALARELGGRPWVGALACVAFIASPLVFGTAAHSLTNDLLPVAGCTVAAALLLRARRAGDTAPVWLAGVALGVAVGTKYTAFAPTAIMALGAFWLLRSRWQPFLVAPGLLALAGPWLLRNLVAAGNPLYPQSIRLGGVEVFEGGSGPLDPLSGTFGGHVVAGRESALTTWWDLSWLLYGPLLPAAVAGIVVGLWTGSRQRHAPTVAASLLAATSLLAYAATPYTGAGDPPLAFLMGSNLRYAMIGVLLGLIVLVARMPFPASTSAAFLLAVWSAWKLFDRPMRPDTSIPVSIAVMAVAVGVVASVATVAVHRSPHWSRLLPAEAFAASIALAIVAVTATSAERPVRPLESAISSAAAVTVRTSSPDDARDVDVVAVGVPDLRSLIGPRFGHRPVPAGTDVIDSTHDDPLLLRAAVDATDAKVLVVGYDQPGIPEDFLPSASWCPVRSVGAVVVFVRDAPEPCADDGPGG